MLSLKSLLPTLLRQFARDEETTLVFLTELWPQVVGEALSRRTRPVALRAGKLTVAVESESWRRELERLRPGMVRSVNDCWGMKLIDRIAIEFHPID